MSGGPALVPHARPERNSDWWWFETEKRGLTVHVGDWAADLPHPALPGLHQAENAALAVVCLRRLDGFDVGDSAMAQGLSNAVWPARLQHLTEGPLAGLLPEGSDLWLDGGHNAAAGIALANTFRAWHAGDREARPLYVVLGLMRTKDPVAFFTPFAPLTRRVHAVPIPGENSSIEPDALANTLAHSGARATPCADVESALRAIARDTGSGIPPRVLICGSIYLAGHVLKRNGTPVA